MGRPIEPVHGERFMVPAHLLDTTSPEEHYVLRVVGNDMAEEYICDGDYVVVQRRDPRPGELTVVLVGDEATVKRWYPEGAIVKLVPLCADKDPILVPFADARAQGVVVGLMRKF
jgi:repressor LexA